MIGERESQDVHENFCTKPLAYRYCARILSENEFKNQRHVLDWSRRSVAMDRVKFKNVEVSEVYVIIIQNSSWSSKHNFLSYQRGRMEGTYVR